MEKAKKEMLERLKNVESMEEYNLEMLGKADDVEIDDVKYLGQAELNYKVNGKKETEIINVYAVIEGKTIKYYSDDMPLAAETQNIGHRIPAIIPSPEYEKIYEEDNPIKDIIENLKQKEKEEQERPEKERIVASLRELEKEEKEEQKQKVKNEEFEVQKSNDLIGRKPKYVIQTIDIDKTYIDDWTTVRKGFNIPSGVEKIAIAKPMQKDENVLSADMTMYMLDKNGNIIENAHGKTIDDLFTIDRATGKNPMNDENTKMELHGSAERNRSHTMRRFKSKENPDLYISAEQKEVGDYAQIYVGRKTMYGNDAVEVQLETRNVGIQTSLQMQKMVAGYKGIYNIEDIDQEVDELEEKGEDIKNIQREKIENEEEYERFRKGPWDK